MTPLKTICPKCMADATIHVNLTDGDAVTCQDCNEEYTVTDVRALVESWGPA